MSKRLIGAAILLGSTCLLGSIVIIILAYDLNLGVQQSTMNPSYSNSHPETGYFKINPETILASLGQGNTDVFMPLLEDPNSVESLTGVSISWTQKEYLEIASALGQSLWNDPMSLEQWNIDDVLFRTDCRDNLVGFEFASITYFRPDITNGKRIYITRHIEIDPYYSMVRWGSGAVYPRPILLKWRSFDLVEAKFTADDALQIAEENGGRETRFRVANKCVVYVSSPEDNKHRNWILSYLIPPNFVNYDIDLDTGQYKILGAKP